MLKAAAKNPKKIKMIENSIESAKNLEIPLEVGSKSAAIAKNKIKVIDMTGKEQRVMHGYESLSQINKMSRHGDESNENGRPKNFDVPELVHNIDMLLDMTEEKILVGEKKLKHYEDSLVALAYDEKRTRERLSGERRQLQRMSQLLENVEK